MFERRKRSKPAVDNRFEWEGLEALEPRTLMSGTPFAISDGSKEFGVLDPDTGAFSPVGILRDAADTTEFTKVENLSVNQRTGIVYGINEGKTLLMIDPATGIATIVGVDGAVALNDVDAMTINPFTEQLFAVDATPETNPGVLHSIDMVTGESTFIANLAFADGEVDPLDFPGVIDPKIDGIAFTPDGQTLIGAYSSYGDASFIVEIDAVTGEMTVIGAAGVDDIEDIAFDPDGVLHGSLGDTGAIGEDPSGSFEGLVTIDINTGAATPVGLFGVAPDESDENSFARGVWDMEGLAFGLASNVSPVILTQQQILQQSFTQPRVLGDSDLDGDVDIADLFSFRASYGSELSDVGYNVQNDLDIDGDVDIADLFGFRANYGRSAEELLATLSAQYSSSETDFAGNSSTTAFNLGALAGNRVGAGFIGGNDTVDYYKFSVGETSSFQSNLLDSFSQTTITLLDANLNIIDSTNTEDGGSLSAILAAGEYFIVIDSTGPSSAYLLGLSTTSI